MMNKKRESRGVSPIIATVLLIAMVIVIALIVFLWIREIGGETITKLEGENIESVCGKVEYSLDFYNSIISVSNTGIVPIFSFKVKIEEEGSHRTVNIADIGNSWPDTGISQGESFESDPLLTSNEVGSATKIVLIPVLMGESDMGEKTYICKEEQYGQEIVL